MSKRSESCSKTRATERENLDFFKLLANAEHKALDESLCHHPSTEEVTDDQEQDERRIREANESF